MSQAEAWFVYDRWIQDDRVDYLEKPPGLEARFRALTRAERPEPKAWGDSYLCSFAETADLRLVTFDQALRSKIGRRLAFELAVPDIAFSIIEGD